MKKIIPLPSQKILVECFNYDPLTGELFWKHRPQEHFSSKHAWVVFNAKFAGSVVGAPQYNKHGEPTGIRLRITVKTSHAAFYAHRIIYALMGIEIPEGFEVDHKNLNATDNSWLNLRLATYAQNTSNSGVSRGKASGLPKGVFRHGRKFVSAIKANGVLHRLGDFDTPESAHAAYCKKAAEIHGEFARFN